MADGTSRAVIYEVQIDFLLDPGHDIRFVSDHLVR